MEIKSLTGIRGIAAIWVMLLHFNSKLVAIIPEHAYLEFITLHGAKAVDLFFILSGFIMAYVYEGTNWNKAEVKSYVVKRFARVYPIHLVTLMILIIMVTLAFLLGKDVEGDYSIVSAIQHIFLLHCLPFVSSGAWNYPSWSISAEFIGYLFIFPVGIALVKFNSLRRVAPFICFSCLLFYLGFLSSGCAESWRNVVRIACEFLAGLFLYYSVAQYSKISLWCNKALLLLLATICLSCYLCDKVAVSVVLILTFPLIIAGLSKDSGIVCKILSTKLLYYLGLISYSLYMCHAIVEKAFKVIFPLESLSDDQTYLRVLIYGAHIIIPIIFAAILYQFVEQPARRWICKKI